jgi:hypothetical protein
MTTPISAARPASVMSAVAGADYVSAAPGHLRREDHGVMIPQTEADASERSRLRRFSGSDPVAQLVEQRTFKATLNFVSIDADTTSAEA